MRIVFTPSKGTPSDFRSRFLWQVDAADEFKRLFSNTAYGATEEEALAMCLGKVLIQVSAHLADGTLTTVVRESGPIVIDLPVEEPRKETP